MKISIITAVYNREQTIGEALQSVTAQRYQNVEHIIIDGGSSDATLAVVDQNRHDEMRIVSEPDGGIYDALNKGIAMAGGDVIGLMHSDDFYADDYVLSDVAAAFLSGPVSAVYGDLDYISAMEPGVIIRRWRSGEFNVKKLRRGWMPPHPTLFLRREVIETYGAYDTNYRIAADYDAVLRYFGSGALGLRYIPRVLVKMRVGGESNRSLSHIIQKSREDYRALRANRVGGVKSLVWKNLSKLPQFFGNRPG